MEAASGFEPLNEGFADLCLSHLATPPLVRSELRVESWEWKEDDMSRELRDVICLTPNSELDTLNSKYGAGGGIRTRDPNLGKVSGISTLPFPALSFFPFRTLIAFRKNAVYRPLPLVSALY
jgi:hypothetical protein